MFSLLPKFTTEQIKLGILKEIDDLHAQGVTAFKDTATGAEWEALRQLNGEGKLNDRACILWRAGKSVASAQATMRRCRKHRPRHAFTNAVASQLAARRSSWMAAR